MVSKYVFEYLDEDQRARFIADEIADLEREADKLKEDEESSS